MPTLSSTLGPILCATVAAPDAAAVASAYARCLGWGVLEDGTVSPALAASWGAPDLDGSRTLLLGSEGRSEGLVRVVEIGAAGEPAGASGPLPGDYLRSPGWRSIEICVTDVHAVRARLDDPAFRVVGEPEPLPGSETIHAMQAIGPAGELLYLTELGPQSAYELPTPVAPVDRVFIAVLSAPDLDRARDWYVETFGATDPAGSLTTPIGSVNRALGLPADHAHTFCGLQLHGRNLVEVDGHPAELLGEPPAAGAAPAPLRPGVALFTLELDGSIEELGLAPLTAPDAHAAPPYAGRRSAVVIGPAGERIELVERA